MIVIPKIIIQTSKYLPNRYRVEKLKEYSLGYSYEHYTDEEIITFFRNNPDIEFREIENKFYNFKLGQHKADLFRYYYLYKKGGVYIDIDCILYDDIDSIIKNYKFVGVDSGDDKAFNGFICCEPNNLIMYHALKHIYFIDVDNLENDYHIFCRELSKIISIYKDSSVDLLQEHFIDDGISTIKNNLGEHKLSHFYKTKIIPITFITKTNDYS